MASTDDLLPADPGPAVTTAANAVYRKRGFVIAVICQRIEMLDLDPDELANFDIDTWIAETLHLVKEGINDLSDLACDLLTRVADNEITVNSMVVEMLSEVHRSVIELREAHGGP